MEDTKGSFMDNYPNHIQDVILSDIADQLVGDWMNSNADEGTFYADLKIAEMSTDDVKADFNSFYGLTADDDDYQAVS